MQPNDTARLCSRCQDVFVPRPNEPGIFCSRKCYAEQRSESAAATRAARFDSYVDRSGDCWLWRSTMHGGGYGQFGMGHGRAQLAHRVAWQLATGDTLARLDVIGHICDVRACVRNDDEGTYEVRGIVLPRRGHLFKGKHTHNSLDMLEKGRNSTKRRHGEAHRGAKLTEAEVIAIRERYAQGGITNHALAEEYGVSSSLISNIVLRISWRHVE